MTANARISSHQGKTALDMLPLARSAGDADMVAACIAIRNAYLIGRPVDRGMLEAFMAFAADLRQGGAL